MHILDHLGSFLGALTFRYKRQHTLLRQIHAHDSAYRLLELFVHALNFGTEKRKRLLLCVPGENTLALLLVPKLLRYDNLEVVEGLGTYWRVLVFQSKPLQGHNFCVVVIPAGVHHNGKFALHHLN